ncbi:MAG: AAA family ATPase, partial [Candidatus Moraniibacteriota bacterium]
MSIERNLKKKIENDFGKRKIILVYGARQVGKTTLMKEILVSFSGEKVLYNCDLDAMRELLGKQNLEHLRSLVEKYELIIIDEAQRVPNIGLTLKILIDAFPEKQFIVTGSSSFELASAISEP